MPNLVEPNGKEGLMTRTFSNPNRIDEETLCANSVIEWLHKRLPSKSISCRPEENDPPDYWLQIDSKTFALEITSVVEKVEGNNGPLEAITWENLWKNLTKKIEDEAVADGILDGSYHVYVIRNPPLDEEAIRNGCFEFFRSNPSIENVGRKIVDTGSGFVAIYKFADSPNTVQFVGRTIAKGERQVDRELGIQLQDILQKKLGKLLCKPAVQSCGGLVLALYDAYLFATIPQVRRILAGVPIVQRFSAIFWIQATRKAEDPRPRHIDPIVNTVWCNDQFLT